MKKQDAVKQPTVEQPTETESAPVEEQPKEEIKEEVQSTDTQEVENVEETETLEPADATIEPEKPEVSKDVPYERFKEVNDELKQYKSQGQQRAVGDIPQLEPDAAQAVGYETARQIDTLEEQKFLGKHETELKKDPLLEGVFYNEFRKRVSEGRGYVDREAVLEDVKKLVESRVSPQIKQATQQGVEEGKEIARKKEQAGAVGETGVYDVKTDDELTAAEFAKKYGLKRV